MKMKLFRSIRIAVLLMTGALTIVSCDTYTLNDKEPDWLGESIYKYLSNDSDYTYYTQLIEDLDYVDVLNKTGSKTLFVANDSAFEAFFENNEWNVHRYSDLTLAQKNLLLFFGMIDNAYLVDMLANYNNGGLKEGAAFRRETAVSVIDSIPFVNGANLPQGQYWDFYRDKGIYMLKDNTPMTLIHFTQKHLEQAQISDEDFRLITGVTRQYNDAHVFGIKIIKKDITCKNGYINVLEKVMIPPMNMAEFMNSNSNLTEFAKIINRFCAPYPDDANTILYRQKHIDFNDTIFTLKYYAKVGGRTAYPKPGQTLTTDMLLPFDPGWNSYERTTSGNALQSDMAAMFIPTNQAMTDYFNSPEGAVLKDRFNTWADVPTDVLPLLLKRHMRTSLIESVPSRFSTMVDEDNSALPVKKSDIVSTYVGTNGVVYQTSKVYPPDDYLSVYGPVLLSANNASPTFKTKIWKWAIMQNDFRLYLNSLISKYSFFVPTDEYFKDYIDPVAINKDVAGALKFWYNERTNAVNATIYKYNKADNTVGDSVGYITSPTFLVNRLLDMLNTHIVVGGTETGKSFYLTKGNVPVKVSNAGTSSMTIQSGGNIERGDVVNVKRVYNQQNGYTYFIDKPIQSSLSSVYKVLSSHDEFKEFFNLMIGFPSTGSSVMFVSKAAYYGVDFNVKFLNTYNYTIYVPTNEAVREAIQNGVIKTWDDINAIQDATVKAAEIVKLERFLRYHFQDNSIFVDNHTVNGVYQSATVKKDDVATHFGTFKNKYYKLGVNAAPGSLSLTTESNGTASVVTSGNLYNIMARDFVFNNKPSAFKNVDGTGTGVDFFTSTIYTSSTAVIHQINKVLIFQ